MASRLGRQDVSVAVSAQDVCAHLQNPQPAGFRYDLALLDPPFKSDWLARAFPLLTSRMNPAGRIYVEWHARLGDDAHMAPLLEKSGWRVEREQRAGQVFYHLLCAAHEGREADAVAAAVS
jgi:hypothetical protein